MQTEYYGWVGIDGYDNVIQIKNNEAYVFRRSEGRFVKNNEFLKAKYDPGSEFEKITKEEAEKIIRECDTMTDQVIRALKIAAKAHDGQTDRAGMPYILHPLTVALAQKTEAAFIAGLLHDVVEDSDYTFGDLRRKGISDDIIEALMLLTHDKDTVYMEYVRKIKTNEIAVAVKIADLEHNSDLTRLPEIGEKDIERAEKYKRALRYLTSESDSITEEAQKHEGKYGDRPADGLE